MTKIKKVTVFCGSNFGKTNKYVDAIRELADTLCENKIELVYGGAKNGLMGQIANRFLKNNIHVTGVIPRNLVKSEIDHSEVTDMIHVDSMHERKEKMSDLADAFILCPGGCGSLDEFFEIYTWAQLNIHSKPIAILNTDNYYKHLILHLKHVYEEKFMKKDHFDMIIVSDDPNKLIEGLRNYKHPQIKKWISDSREVD